jgi:hypothetical protein
MEQFYGYDQETRQVLAGSNTSGRLPTNNQNIQTQAFGRCLGEAS